VELGDGADTDITPGGPPESADNMAAHDPLVGESDIPERADDLDETQLSPEEALSQPLGYPSLPTPNARDIPTGDI
jgi:hypothetical protein